MVKQDTTLNFRDGLKQAWANCAKTVSEVFEAPVYSVRGEEVRPSLMSRLASLSNLPELISNGLKGRPMSVVHPEAFAQFVAHRRFR